MNGFYVALYVLAKSNYEVEYDIYKIIFIYHKCRSFQLDMYVYCFNQSSMNSVVLYFFNSSSFFSFI